MGMVFEGVGGGETLPPDIFWPKSAIFGLFSLISPKFELMGPKKFGRWVPPPLRAPSPLEIFLAF